eukprot:65855_1
MASFYKKNEIVICLSPADQKWHKAKIVENRGTTYRVHYHGWSSSWDEWIHEDFRLCRGSSDATICEQILNQKRKEQQDLIQAHQKEIAQSQPIYHRNGTVCILPLSTQITQHLIQQFELIDHQKPTLWIRLPKPKHLTINGICNAFIRYHSNRIQRENKHNPQEEQTFLEQIVWSIKYYFNRFMDINIVFKSEMKQKEDLMRQYGDKNKNKKIDYCDVYGAEHLFRLLVNLPSIYQNIKNMTPMQASHISQYVSLFNGYLTKHIQSIAVEFVMDNNGLLMMNT